MSPQPHQPDRLIVGVSGATGFVYAVRALDLLRTVGIETHLVVSRAAELNRAYETDMSKRDLEDRADKVYNINDVGAPISSGSFLTRGMLIAPASMRTVGEIASGVTSSLLTRAADVVLKERRRLVVMVREAPLNLIHLRNMTTITEAGGTIFSAGSGVLLPTRDHRGDRRSLRRPSARPIRHPHRIPPLGRRPAPRPGGQTPQ